MVVDGLDNCEQERMVQVLDALELLFCARQNRPFIALIAVDPHIIITAINHNINSALTGTELSGHHYLKNVINMPFYLHNGGFRQLQANLIKQRENIETWKRRYLRHDTMLHGSYISLVPQESAKGDRERHATGNNYNERNRKSITNANVSSMAASPAPGGRDRVGTQ